MASHIGFRPPLPKLQSTGCIFRDDLFQFFAIKGGKGTTAIGTVKVLFLRKSGMFTSQIAKFDVSRGHTGIFIAHENYSSYPDWLL